MGVEGCGDEVLEVNLSKFTVAIGKDSILGVESLGKTLTQVYFFFHARGLAMHPQVHECTTQARRITPNVIISRTGPFTAIFH